jgi:hypothetical protein
LKLSQIEMSEHPRATTVLRHKLPVPPRGATDENDGSLIGLTPESLDFEACPHLLLNELDIIVILVWALLLLEFAIVVRVARGPFCLAALDALVVPLLAAHYQAVIAFGCTYRAAKTPSQSSPKTATPHRQCRKLHNRPLQFVIHEPAVSDRRSPVL